MLYNGQQRAKPTLYDRGLHFGDGVFETIAFKSPIKACEHPLIHYHWQRLNLGCDVLELESMSKDLLCEQIDQLRQSQVGMIKVILSRVQPQRGYPIHSNQTDCRVFFEPMPFSTPKPWRLGLSRVRLGHQPLLAGIKHLNRLEQVLATKDMVDEDEVLVRCQNDYVIEGTRTNLIVFDGKHWSTPDLSQCGVASCARAWLLEHHDLSIKSISVPQLENAQAVAMISSGVGIVPVDRFEQIEYDIEPALELSNQCIKKGFL